jgi:hypothetical protein
LKLWRIGQIDPNRNEERKKRRKEKKRNNIDEKSKKSRYRDIEKK